MDPKIQQEILNKLDMLGAKFGVASQYLWAVAIKQVYINGAEAVLMAICSFWFAFICKKKYSQLTYGSVHTSEEETIIAVALITAVTSLIFGLIFTCIAMDSIFNAPYIAFKNILSELR